MKASHQERESLIGLQTVKLKRGQFIFGRKVASKQLDMAPFTVYNYMKWLKLTSKLNINIQILLI